MDDLRAALFGVTTMYGGVALGAVAGTAAGPVGTIVGAAVGMFSGMVPFMVHMLREDAKQRKDKDQ